MKILLTISVFFLALSVKAQDKERGFLDFWSVGYFGEKVTNPGFTVSLGKSILLNKPEKEQRDRLDYSLALASYIHPKNHIGLQVKPQLSYYHIFWKSFEIGLKTDFGYMRRFYNGETFEVSDNGDVNKKTLAGQNALIYGAYLSLGQNLSVFKDKPVRWFVEIGAFWEYPYNNYSLFHPAVSIGISKPF